MRIFCLFFNLLLLISGGFSQDGTSTPRVASNQGETDNFFFPAHAFIDSAYTVLAFFPDKGIPVMRAQEAKTIHVNKAAHFIDARDPEEFKQGHIPDALNIPFDRVTAPEYTAFLDSLPKSTPLIVYCNTHLCIVSHQAAEQIIFKGFSKVIIMEGFMVWKESGYPTRKSDQYPK